MRRHAVVCPGRRRATAHAAARRVCQAGSSPCGVVESEISESRFSTNKWWEHNLGSAESGFESKTEEAAGSRDPRIIPDMIPMRKNTFFWPTCAQWKASIAVSNPTRIGTHGDEASITVQRAEYRIVTFNVIFTLFCMTRYIEKQMILHSGPAPAPIMVTGIRYRELLHARSRVCASRGDKMSFSRTRCPKRQHREEKPKRDGFPNVDTSRTQPAAQAGHLTVRRGAEPERRSRQTNSPLHLQKGEGFA